VSLYNNLRIHIFTCEGKAGGWNVSPDPATPTSVAPAANWTPGMYLYHSNDNHYDLLANDDSRHGDGENEPKTNSEA
jgi:hypothetical protein